MGEVYRARDPKLRRDVAIKVLPEAFSEDEERLARFEREARVLASLSHPNIATIHGLEAEGGVGFLVMECVEGATLADRISKGPIPVEESLGLFMQIAEALEWPRPSRATRPRRICPSLPPSPGRLRERGCSWGRHRT
jgi:serine/threonine-protein kinase